jgi:putative DNA primase/helicase
LSSSSLHKGLATMKALAQARSKEITPVLRVGGSTEEIWLDLGGRDWELVKVTKEGWRLVTDGVPSVRFIRKPGMLALPMPVKGGNIQELRPFLNLRDEDFVLDVGWLLGALRPKGPYAVAIKSGVSNSAKTSGALALKRAIDPNYADLRPFRSEDDMYIGANSSWIQAYDNISRIKADDADVLCRISTGIGYAKRALRTDADQFLMRVCRPIVLNGIPNDLAERGDLATRVIIQELPALDEETQKFEEEFWQEYEAAHPRILGALLNGVVGAMRGYREVSLQGFGTIRLADFARWAEAGCRALGFEKDEFLTAFTGSQERAMRIAFNQDLVARAVALLIEQNPGVWRGNTKPLLAALEKAVRKAKQTDILEHKAWPKNDTWLGRLLRRSAAVLRKACNIEIEFDIDLRPTSEGDKDGIEIKKGPEH